MVSIRTLVSSAVAMLAVPALAAIPPAEVVNNIKTLTAKSQALQAPAQTISIINGPLIIIGQGPFPKIIAGFADIVSTATTAISGMKNPGPITAPADATAIAEAFRDFVRVHQALLNILIGKAGLFTTVPLIGAPVAAVLRQVEGVVDTIAFSLIDSVEVTAQKNSIQQDSNSLHATIELSINNYEGVVTVNTNIKREAKVFVA
ncbi:hypothetical protein QBC42DRAFT_340639 [Cladorrhinum samala]|uniref:Uncharacterized protein n=1 Tax=Cladorrhinum samala TaxID=585594 RepID=A0AAV9HE95_9PEZI|nr:hypothetical protein QBC42DRAFT_340639 [Cladorrhinum samala]